MKLNKIIIGIYTTNRYFGDFLIIFQLANYLQQNYFKKILMQQ